MVSDNALRNVAGMGAPACGLCSGLAGTVLSPNEGPAGTACSVALSVAGNLVSPITGERAAPQVDTVDNPQNTPTAPESLRACGLIPQVFGRAVDTERGASAHFGSHPADLLTFWEMIQRSSIPNPR